MLTTRADFVADALCLGTEVGVARICWIHYAKYDWRSWIPEWNNIHLLAHLYNIHLVINRQVYGGRKHEQLLEKRLELLYINLRL